MVIIKEQYEFSLTRIEQLLPLVDDNVSTSDVKAVELSLMSDIVIAYEKERYPIEQSPAAMMGVCLSTRAI